MPSNCIVPSCKASSSKGDGSRIFHVLPNDPNMCDKWFEVIGLHDADHAKKKSGSYRVCSDHFDDSCYHMKRSLLKTAVPNLKLRSNESVTATNAQTQTNNEPNPEEACELIKPSNIVEIDEHSLRVEINRRTEVEAIMSIPEPRNSEEFLNYSREFLGPKTLKLITCQMLMKKYDKRKLPVKHKLFYLDLYYHNPRAYRFLQQFMSLPPTATLQNFYLNLNSGYLSPRCMLVLSSMMAQMDPKDKRCIVSIASTTVKKHVYYDIKNDTLHGLHQVDYKQWKNPANKAYVFVVKGLLSTWQMPVAFALFHDSDVHALRLWTDSIIRILVLKGLDICAFVSKQIDDDCKILSELRSISSERNAFSVTKEKIYNIFDVRYLVKSLRDTLMKFDIAIASEGVATWEHVMTFYNTEKELQLNLAAGSTQTHVNPDENERTSIESAVQLFSKTTAAAMRMFLRLKLLNESAVATVNLINRVSELLDSLNSDTLKPKKPLPGEKSQENLLKEMYVYFEGFRRFVNGVRLDDKIEPVVGLMGTIKSISELSKDLSKKGGSQLITRSLNLEFVEDCFREIYAHDKKRKKKCQQITSIEFIRGFNKYFLSCFIKNARLNSSKNIKSSLSKLHEYLAEKTEEKDQSLDLEAKSTSPLLLDNLEHKIILPNQKVLRFIAGYLMKIAVEQHNCNKLMIYLTPSELVTKTFIDSEYLGVQLPIDFVLFVVKLEHEFVNALQQDVMPQKVGASALKAMSRLVFLPCRCFPLFLIKTLFIRIRIYNFVKDINRQLKERDVFIIDTFDL